MCCTYGRNRESVVRNPKPGCNWQHCMWLSGEGRWHGVPEGLGTATAGSGEILKVFTYGFLPAATCHILTRLVAESGIPNLAQPNTREPNRKMSHKCGPMRFMCSSLVMTMPAMQIHAWPTECALDNNTGRGCFTHMWHVHVYANQDLAARLTEAARTSQDQPTETRLPSHKQKCCRNCCNAAEH